MAVNKYPFVKNIYGHDDPLTFPALVQAGATAAIKKGEICTFNETAGYWIPASAVADACYKLAISAEEQKATDIARYIDFYALREGDVWEFAIDAAAGIALGEGLTLTASDSQKLTRDLDGVAVAVVIGMDNYPQIGTTLTSKSFAQVMFLPSASHWQSGVVRNGLMRVAAKTAAYTLKPEDCGILLTNTGAGGAVTITAPVPTTSPGIPVGWHFRMLCTVAEDFIFDPKPDGASLVIKSAAQAAGVTAGVDNIGDFMGFCWDGTNWLSYTGTSGAEAGIDIA